MSDIQLIENPIELICACSSIESLDSYYTKNRACITIDGRRFAWNDKIEEGIVEYIVFPYSLEEWNTGKYSRYKCEKCKYIGFKIVPVVEYNKQRERILRDYFD